MVISPSKRSFHAYRTTLIASTWVCSMLAGCEERSPTSTASAPAVASSAALSSASARTSPPTPPASSTLPPASSTPSPKGSAPAASSALAIDLSAPEINFGPPVPAVLGGRMMVARTKGDDLIVSRWNGSSFEPISADPEGVSPWPVALAAGSKTHAYWASQGQIVRREILPDGKAGPKTVVATDAALSSPVVAARSSGHEERDVVLYIGSKVSAQGERAARLWVEGQESRPVSREAGGATSIALVHLGATRFALLTLDGRLAMSPVHAISLELDGEGHPDLGEDRVVHVAGPAERQTALTGVLVGRGPVALLPISKTSTDFGLLVLRIGYEDDPPRWVDYPNGLDPAPLTAAVVCNKPTVAFVRPNAPEAGSPRVLEIGVLDAQAELRDRRVLATSPAISHVSLWGDASSGWIVFTTEQGLRGRRLECR